MLLCYVGAGGKIDGGTLGKRRVGLGMTDGCTLGGLMVDASDVGRSSFMVRLVTSSEVFGTEALVSGCFVKVWFGNRTRIWYWWYC